MSRNGIQVTLLGHDVAKWDAYVHSSSQATSAHLAAWRTVISESFGHSCYYLRAEEDGAVVGVLPLVFLSSHLFGRFLVSIPFLNYGGLCANNDRTSTALLEHAAELAAQLEADHIEFRHTPCQEIELPCRAHKVAMRLGLPETTDSLWASFKPKVRNTIRRARKRGLSCKVGRLDCLNDFYAVFSHNMRDLGTPVYSKAFFKNILNQFPAQTQIVQAMWRGRTVAAALLFWHRKTIEIPWAASLRTHNHLAGNMLMYWHALAWSCEHGFDTFDFGRCTPGSGTHAFKKQWGAKPLSFRWQYWLRGSQEMPDISPTNPKYKLAIGIWQRLPVFLTRIIGPPIIRNIP